MPVRLKSTLLPVAARGGISGSSLRERRRRQRRRLGSRTGQDLRDSLLAFLATGQGSEPRKRHQSEAWPIPENLWLPTWSRFVTIRPMTQTERGAGAAVA